ncbi:MAG: hypothetical protein J1E56_03645 [Ruminococcus sp.]|nr:hypothetical protein [Ruminococcus sp.]
MFSIRLANHNFNIENKYNYVYKLCKKYYSNERSGILISVTDDEILQEQTGGYSLDYLESLAIYRKIAEYLIDHETLLFHGSAIAVDHKAYLFTAPSGTGKSTHARLWRKLFGQRAVMINDDKPFLKMTDRGVLAYGTPWDGKHHLSTNTSAPLKAICILERSEINYIEPITQSDALPMLMQHCYRPSDPVAMKKTLSLIERLGSSVKLYRMGCNMEPEAAQIAYNGMNERNEPK